MASAQEPLLLLLQSQRVSRAALRALRIVIATIIKLPVRALRTWSSTLTEPQHIVQ